MAIMVFQVPKSRRNDAAARFEFTTGDTDKAGEPVVHSIPLLQFLPVQSAELFEVGQQVGGILHACETDEARAAVRAMDAEQFEEFMAAWNAASKVKPGESSASSES